MTLLSNLYTGGGDVTAAANLTDKALTVGDGGAKGIKTLALGAADLKLFINAAGNANEYASGIKVGTFSRDTAVASGDQAVSGVGFKPSAVIFFSAIDSSLEGSWGFDNGTNHEMIAINREGNSGTFVNHISNSIVLYQAAGVSYGGIISAIGADGFTITWTKGGAKTGTANIHYVAFR